MRLATPLVATRVAAADVDRQGSRAEERAGFPRAESQK